MLPSTLCSSLAQQQTSSKSGGNHVKPCHLWISVAIEFMRPRIILLLPLLLFAVSCKQQQQATPTASPTEVAAASPSPSASPTPPRPTGPIEFTDVSAEAGIRFKHNSGAFGKKYLPETIGSGC